MIKPLSAARFSRRSLLALPAFVATASLIIGAGSASAASPQAVDAQSPPRTSSSDAPVGASYDGSRVSALYERLKNDPVRLEMFLRAFPKGADLHNHLIGAIYAESYLRWAAEDGLCVSVPEGTILSSACDMGARGQKPAAALPQDATSWNLLVDALSMRDFVPTDNDRSGHDHFFGTFARFMSIQGRRQGEMLAEGMEHAARDHVQYVEFMISPGLGEMMVAGKKLHLAKQADIASAHTALAPEVPGLVAQARAETDQLEKRARDLLKCGTPEAAPACRVTVRYLYQTVRTMPPPQVYSQLEGGYALVKADPRFVGVNLVAPEDDPVAVRDYTLQMQMFQALNGYYPDVPLSLHAGELTPALVPPSVLESHISQAIETAGARRIGHGIDVSWENDPAHLLAEMARKKVMVEINLTSNQEILRVSGKKHPFRLYRRAHVPVALSTDDEGISRGSLTQEYQKAATWFGLSYPELVTLSRTGLEYAFLPGESLWRNREPGQFSDACRNAAPSRKLPEKCAALIEASPKARVQWQLEEKLAAFAYEAAHVAPNDPVFSKN